MTSKTLKVIICPAAWPSHGEFVALRELDEPGPEWERIEIAGVFETRLALKRAIHRLYPTAQVR